MDSSSSDHHASDSTESKSSGSGSPRKHPKPSTMELLSSAKCVAEAAKSTLNHETDKLENAKIAGAAADLLSAASEYGKLEDNPLGKYVQQAEDFLHQYQSSHSSATSTPSGQGHSSSSPHGSSAEGEGHGHSGSGGYGDYLKMAQGLLKK